MGETPKTYELVIGKDPEVKFFTKEDLILKINESVDYLNNCKSHNLILINKINTKTYPDKNEEYFSFDASRTLKVGGRICESKLGILGINWNKPHTAYTAREKEYLLDNIKESNSNIDFMLDKCNCFLKRLNSDKLKMGDYFPCKIVKKYSQNWDKKWSEWNEIVTYTITDIVKCNICGTTIKIENLKKHQARIICKDRGQENQLMASGMVSAPEKVYNLVVAGKFPGELVPVEYRVYVPRWVIDAFNVYTKNNGFAGMKLEDYLNKMAKDKNAPQGVL